MPKAKYLQVPALAGGNPWRPTSRKQITAVANMAVKYLRSQWTDAQGHVSPSFFPALAGELEESFVFPSWVQDKHDRKHGGCTGPPVDFRWRDFWEQVAGK